MIIVLWATSSVGNECTDNIRDVVSITDTRDDTNVLSNSEPTTTNNIRDVNITCSTAATMPGITFGDGGATICIQFLEQQLQRLLNIMTMQPPNEDGR